VRVSDKRAFASSAFIFMRLEFLDSEAPHSALLDSIFGGEGNIEVDTARLEEPPSSLRPTLLKNGYNCKNLDTNSALVKVTVQSFDPPCCRKLPYAASLDLGETLPKAESYPHLRTFSLFQKYFRNDANKRALWIQPLFPYA
jgi:hypothetical protein